MNGSFRASGSERRLTVGGRQVPDASSRHRPFNSKKGYGSRALTVIDTLKIGINPKIETSLATYVHCQYTMSVRIQYELQGVAFEWDSDKADTNVQKHGVSFHAACEVFFDPFVRIVDTSNPTESREAAIGYTEGERLLFVVHVIRHEETIRIISAREATREERRQYENP